MFGYLSGSMRRGLSDWRAEDYVYEISKGTRKLKFHARVFETANPPGHLWDPGGVSSGYKILWEVKFETNLAQTAGSLK